MTEYQEFLRAADADTHGPAALTALVTAGTTAFEGIRVSAETRLGTDFGLFEAWMITAAEAADGRDALLSVQSARPGPVTSVPPLCRAEIATLAADLSRLLGEAAGQAADGGDVTALGRATACANRVRDLMAGDTP